MDRLARGVNDGIVDGYPHDITRERASHGEPDSAFVRLTWNTPQTIDRVWPFARPTERDQVTAARLIFSDGSTHPTGALPDDARRGLEARFAPKTVKWLAFCVTVVKPGNPNIGLGELVVFAAKPKFNDPPQRSRCPSRSLDYFVAGQMPLVPGQLAD